MRKRLFLLSLLIPVIHFYQVPMALAAKTTPPASPMETIHIVGSEVGSKDVNSILEVVSDLIASSNKHDMDGVLKHYSPRFQSGDNLSLDEIHHLIEETWKTYPDIHYDTKTLEIRINGDWATVESLDSAKATAVSDATVSKTPGMLDSRSRGLLFMKRMGKTWEILSDYTVYENATILYGEAQKLNVSLSTPDQVFSGEPYTAKVEIKLPTGAFAIATISKDPLVYPQPKPEEKFRSLSDEQDSLERVFQANTTNNNEMITATVGLTQIGQDDQDRPTIKLNGIATIVKRVNVLPKSKYAEQKALNSITKTSASGLIDLTHAPASSSGSDDGSA
ncbi:MAG: hypothetical protein K2X66_11700, partial [Cyanobacteria bacterium]|nr:hypothetical protein [Cyanobacteriota bacterium]